MTRAVVIGAAPIVFVFSLGFFVTPAILGGGLYRFAKLALQREVR